MQINNFDWNTAVQAIVIAFSTWYVRRGSKKDSESVKQATASEGSLNEVLNRLGSLELDMELVKSAILKDPKIVTILGYPKGQKDGQSI